MLNCSPFKLFLYISYIGKNKNPPITNEIGLLTSVISKFNCFIKKVKLCHDLKICERIKRSHLTFLHFQTCFLNFLWFVYIFCLLTPSECKLRRVLIRRKTERSRKRNKKWKESSPRPSRFEISGRTLKKKKTIHCYDKAKRSRSD